MPFAAADIADAIAQGLKRRAADDDDEQVVYGFDTLAELQLHPLLKQSLEQAGYHVLTEQRYPVDRRKKSKTQGRRCDLVLLPENLPIRDPLIKGTLFDHQPALDIEQAYFLEVKTVAQFEIDGPFRRYSAELLGTVAKDVRKLSRDVKLIHGGLLLVLFTADAQTAEHDIDAWYDRVLRKKHPVQPPAMRGFPITDRVGNGWCQVAVFDVRGGRAI